jgi:outer membrane autotransporter protein
VDLLAHAPLRAGGIQAAAAAPDVADGPSESGRRFGLWVDGVGLFGSVSGDGNSADTSWRTGGANAGFDVRLGRHVLLGLGGGYGRLNVEVDDRGFDGDANVFQGALYAAWVGERAYVSGLGRYAWVDFETRRDIIFDGIDRSARADYDGHELSGYLEAGYVAFALAGAQLEPVGAFHFLRLESDGFTESGADSLDLEVDDDSWSSLVASGGLRVHKAFVFDDAEGLLLLPELRVRFGYEFGDDDRDLDAVLTGATLDGAYSLTGATAARGGLLLGAGWTVLRHGDLGFFFQYDANLNSDLVAHALVAGGVLRW